MAVSQYTLLLGLRAFLVENPLTINTQSKRKEKYQLEVGKIDQLDLILSIIFVCLPAEESSESECSIGGYRGNSLGFCGWHWGYSAEKTLIIYCVNGLTPQEAVDQLITRVKPFYLPQIMSKCTGFVVNRRSRPVRFQNSRKNKATPPEYNALHALGLDKWPAIEEKAIIRALLVPFPRTPFHTQSKFPVRLENETQFLTFFNTNNTKRASHPDFSGPQFEDWTHHAIDRMIQVVPGTEHN